MSQPQKSPHEEFIMTFIVLFLVGAIGWVIWYLFKFQLLEALRWIRVGELWLVRALYGDDYTLYITNAGAQKISQWRKWLPTADVRALTYDDIRVTTHLALIPLRTVFTLVLGVLTVWVIFRGPGTQYHRRMGLETLMKEQAKSFPSIYPFLKFDPRKQPFRAPGTPVPAQLPLFSEALSPEEWMAYHEVKMIGGQIDTNQAYQALSKQLGKRWRGAQELPLHAQALFAAFALTHVRKRKESYALLDQLSMSWSPEKGFRPSSKLKAQIRKIIKNPKIGGELQKYANQHAYETTALLRSLSRAREEGGVLAPAQFLWLRGHDRTLWYPLNNLGRKAYHAEAAGAMVHYTNELIASQKIPTPRFEEVIRNIETYMKSSAARTIPELDRKAGGAKSWKK